MRFLTDVIAMGLVSTGAAIFADRIGIPAFGQGWLILMCLLLIAGGVGIQTGRGIEHERAEK